MERLPVTITIDNVEDITKLPGSFIRKHAVDGRAGHAGDVINVEVDRWPGATPATVQACLGHEVGHSEILRTIEQDDMAGLDRFRQESDAWLRWANRRNGRPQELLVGELILDALNSYRRGYDIPDDRWEETRRMVESWSVDPNELSHYEPLEPDPFEPPPGGCGGTPGQPGGLGQPGEGKGEGGEGSDGDGDGSGGSAGGDEREPIGDEGEAGEGGRNENENSGGSGGSGGGESDGRDSEFIGGASDERDDDERNQWLHTADGIATTELGRTALTQELIRRRWAIDRLPVLTDAILRRVEG